MTENKQLSIKNDLLKNKKALEMLLGSESKANEFIVAFFNIINSSPSLQTCNQNELILCALETASLNLPINKQLGYVYIVPFKGKPQLQIGYRGMLQYMLKSNEVQNFNFTKLSKNQIERIDFITGEIKVNENEQFSGESFVYIFYVALLNGFKKTFFMTTSEIEEHAKKFSQSFNSKFSPWQTDFDSMAYKTVFKKYAKFLPQSIDLARISSIDGKIFQTQEEKEIKTQEALKVNEETLKQLENLGE